MISTLHLGTKSTSVPWEQFREFLDSVVAVSDNGVATGSGFTPVISSLPLKLDWDYSVIETDHLLSTRFSNSTIVFEPSSFLNLLGNSTSSAYVVVQPEKNVTRMHILEVAKAEYYTEAIAMPTNELRNLTESYLNVRRWRLSAGIFGFLATSIACFAWINQEHSAAIVGGAAAVVIWSMMRWYPSYFAHRTQIGQFDDSKSSPTGS